jgi:hypothetical protein
MGIKSFNQQIMQPYCNYSPYLIKSITYILIQWPKCIGTNEDSSPLIHSHTHKGEDMAVLIHDMKAYKVTGGTAPLTVNPGTRGR